MTLIAGPMATLSHQGLRRLIEEFGGCDEYYTEMIHAPSLLNGGPFEKYYILNDFAADKIVWQLTGTEPESMAKGAQILCGLGGIGIDINMGCSAPAIYKTGAGISWMLKPVEETRAMVSGIKETIEKYIQENPERKIRLSVKLRLGDDDFKLEDFFKFCDMLVDCGVEQIVLHPRTKKEKLCRPPRYHYVQDLVHHFDGNPKKPKIILNGNITDAASAVNAYKAAPDIDGMMIARASAQKPWIFEQIKAAFENRDCAVEQVDLLATAIKFLDDLRNYQPQEFWKTRMQRFFSYYCDNLKFGSYIKGKVLNAKTLEEAQTLFSSYFDQCPDEKILTLKN